MKQILVETYIKKESILRARVKAAVDEQLFATKKAIAQFSSTVSLKNEKSNLSKKELIAFKELSKILLKLSPEEIEIAIKINI